MLTVMDTAYSTVWMKEKGMMEQQNITVITPAAYRCREGENFQ